MLGVMTIVLGGVLSGCVSVKTPGTDVSVDSNGIGVNAPGVDVSLNSNGVNVQAGETRVGVGSKNNVTNVKIVDTDGSVSNNTARIKTNTAVQNVVPRAAQNRKQKIAPPSDTAIECEIIGNNLYAQDGYAKCEVVGDNAYYEFGHKEDECSIVGGNVYSEGSVACKYNKKTKILQGNDGVSNCQINLANKKVVYNSPALRCEIDLESGTVNRMVK